MTKAAYPYPICDVSLPQLDMGYIYVLVSIKDIIFTYIGKTMSIRNIIQQHNSGIGSVSTYTFHIWPYALFAYICGFDSKYYLQFYIERLWK